MTRRTGPRLTLRTRLTALYAAVLVLSAGVLLALTIILVNQSFDLAADAPTQKEYVTKLEVALGQIQKSVVGKPT
ncbi:hypothetical protein, partial [Actinophytocola sp.]|uniref:hypothetical protein n=1 Tax=Actinophytocola sp. TaxID=1872138 RepID=UPI00389ADBB5